MLTRRRFLSILASATALGVHSPARAATGEAGPVIWRGTVMGSMASMTLVHPDREFALELRDRAIAEIDRLEAIFSLYRSDSALSRLNGQGWLDHPPLELVELVGLALRLAQASGGAFDPSVQPLFQLYRRHFELHPSDRAGPSQDAIDAACAFVDHRAVRVAIDRIVFDRPGMSLTLNGIAPGFVTDRVAMLLRAAGMDNLLLDLGEIRASGQHPDGRPWEAGIAGQALSGLPVRRLKLADEFPALASSAPQGTIFEPTGRHHHLFDPFTGRSVPGRLAVSVIASTAALADGLSTSLAVLEPSRRTGIMAHFPMARAFIAGPDGTWEELAGG